MIAESTVPMTGRVGRADDTHLYTLDVMRFVAAISVVLFHFGIFGYAEPLLFAPAPQAAFAWLRDFGWFGWIGVQVFFTLSGYVIAKSALQQTPGGFLKRRFVRIAPALWIGVLLAFSIRAASGDPLSQLVPAALKSAALSPKGPYIDGVVWTLVVEASFYLVIAGLLTRAGTLAARIALFRKAALIIGLASAAFVFALTAAELTGVQVAGAPLAERMGWFPLQVILLQHGVFFALGMLIWLRERAALTRLCRAALPVIVAGCMAQIYHKTLGAYDQGRDPLIPLAIWAAEALLIVWPGLLTSRNLNARAGRGLKFLGLMTYPLYLGHFTLGMYLVPMLGGHFARGSLPFLALCLAIVLGLAAFVTWGPERQLQALLRRWLLPAAGARSAETASAARGGGA